MSIASSDNLEQYPNLLPHCHKIKPPLNDKAIDRVDQLLRRRDVAAFVMETVICNLGVLVPDKRFMTELRRLCRKYGTLFICDEVATGFGRTGRMFACEHFGIEPDILCMAKAITGGYAGMGATIVTDEVQRSIDGEYGAWSSYGWHPLGVDAAIANITYLIKHRDRLLKNVNARSEDFAARLAQMEFEEPATIR